MAEVAQTRGWANMLATLLAAATIILAVVVVVLVRTIGDPPNPPTVEAIAEAVSNRLEEDGYLKKKAFDQRMDRLDEAVSALLTTEDFQRAVGDLKRTLQSCCGTSGARSVGRQPRIWVVFDNAKLDDDPTGTRPPIERLTADSRGIVINEDQQARLRLLATALRACATADRRVRLNIQGYSSTREFLDAQGRPMRDSEALNMKAANLRADSVIAHLREQGAYADNGVDVLYAAWQEYTDIQRPFLDSREEFQSADQELLNRAVFVEVLDSGGCAVEAGSGGDAR